MDSPAPVAAESQDRVLAPSLPIEERHMRDLPYEVFLRDYVQAMRPLIVRDAISAWPALAKWTPEFFKQQFPSKMVQIGYDEQMRFSDFIDGVLASTEEKPGPYMYRLFIHEHLPEVLGDLSPPNAYAFPRRLASPLMMEYWRASRRLPQAADRRGRRSLSGDALRWRRLARDDYRDLR